MGAKKAQSKNAGGQGGNAPKGGKGGKGAKAAMKNAQAEATDAAPKLKGCQKIKFKHILCAKHGKHIEADAKLKELNAGSRAYVSNFEKIAAEYSEDNAKLDGFVTRQALDPEFAQVAFALPETKNDGSVYLGYARTLHGYHIIIVTGRS